jgi:hypothetical protein
MKSRRRLILIGAAILCGTAPFLLLDASPWTALMKRSSPDGRSTAPAKSANPVRSDEIGPGPQNATISSLAPDADGNDVPLLVNASTNASGIARPEGSANADRRCEFEGAAFATVTPDRPTRPSNYLYLRARMPVTICIQDADRKTERVSLSKGEGRRFYGNPPFRLLGDRDSNIEIFYQGRPIDTRKTGPALALHPSADGP